MKATLLLTPQSAALLIRDKYIAIIPQTWDDFFSEGYASRTLPPGVRADSKWLNAYVAAKLVQEEVNGTDIRRGNLNPGPCTFTMASRAVQKAIPELFVEYWDSLARDCAAEQLYVGEL